MRIGAAQVFICPRRDFVAVGKVGVLDFVFGFRQQRAEHINRFLARNTVLWRKDQRIADRCFSPHEAGAGRCAHKGKRPFGDLRNIFKFQRRLRVFLRVYAKVSDENFCKLFPTHLIVWNIDQFAFQVFAAADYAHIAQHIDIRFRPVPVKVGKAIGVVAFRQEDVFERHALRHLGRRITEDVFEFNDAALLWIDG